MASSGQQPDKPPFNVHHLGSSHSTDVLPTQIVKLSKDANISTTKFESSDSMQTHSFTPKEYLTLVESGLLPKLQYHDQIVQLAKIEGNEKDCQIFIVHEK